MEFDFPLRPINSDYELDCNKISILEGIRHWSFHALDFISNIRNHGLIHAHSLLKGASFSFAAFSPSLFVSNSRKRQSHNDKVAHIAATNDCGLHGKGRRVVRVLRVCRILFLFVAAVMRA